MTADLTRLPEALAVPHGCTIRWVQNDAELWVWKLAQDAGFGEDEQLYYDAYAGTGMARRQRRGTIWGLRTSRR